MNCSRRRIMHGGSIDALRKNVVAIAIGHLSLFFFICCRGGLIAELANMFHNIITNMLVCQWESGFI